MTHREQARRRLRSVLSNTCAIASLGIACAPAPRPTLSPEPPRSAPATATPLAVLAPVPALAAPSAEPEAPLEPASAPPQEAPEPCEAPEIWTETGGPKALFSAHGYRAAALPITRVVAGVALRHCVIVLWPDGTSNSDGQPSRVAERIDAGWFRAIENTLARVPFAHVRTLHRVVIDNRPKEHGIAAFDRNSPDDGRDGHTIWLHEHLFVGSNHWARGNYGSYWSYHVNVDGRSFDDEPADHSLFSPVLLHELGHLVMYNLVNDAADRAGTPECARTCADAGTCAALPPLERETGCVTPYCMPFRFQAGTENFAEQYRLYYQSSRTRALLEESNARCVPVLAQADGEHESPWDEGLPDITAFRKSLWSSCGGRPCKTF